MTSWHAGDRLLSLYNFNYPMIISNQDLLPEKKKKKG